MDSHSKQGTTSGTLAWPRLARLGENTKIVYCSRVQNTKIVPNHSSTNTKQP